MGIIFYLSSLSIVSIKGPGGGFAFSDELQHLVMFSGLAFLVFRGVVKTFRKDHVVVTLIISTLYGLSDEIHQIFVDGRFFSLLDLLFDFLGSVIGIVIGMTFYSIIKTIKRRFIN